MSGIDHHTVAAIAISGSCLDVLGSLYLAYDLLGGEHGPLRLLTRAVTYSILFGIGFGVSLGPFFGFFAGVTTGVTLSIEFNRVARGFHKDSLLSDSIFSLIRGVGVGIGLYRLAGLPYAIAFAFIITVSQVVAYSQGIRPGMDYSTARRPRFTRKQLMAIIIRTFGYMGAALVCGVLFPHIEHPIDFAIRVGVTTGVVSGLGLLCRPFIERFADNLPERALGVFGVLLILCGFALQSLQYWLTLLDVRVT